jgi:dTDP-4-amino-4,6-dideoxygalactose transaminase
MDHGIECGIHYTPAVHGHAAWKDYPVIHGDLPVAEAWAAEELSLPMHPDLEPSEIERVADAVRVAIAAPARAGHA